MNQEFVNMVSFYLILRFIELIIIFFFKFNFTGESISVDSIRNCVKLLEKWSVLEISSSTGMRMLSLGGLYDTVNGVESVIERIQKCVPFCN